MITLKGIRKSYKAGNQSLEVLKGIDCEIREGELVAIMGSSGSGKSTLLNVLGLLDDADHGSYKLDGQTMDGLTERMAARYRSQFLGFVFQSFNLISFKTALENVALPLYYQKVPRKERQLKAMEYLKRVGLEDWAGHLPNQMSGGQKQRVAIARALITEPKLILADEPTGNLDSEQGNEVMEMLSEQNDNGTTIVMATHNYNDATYSRRIIKMLDGQLLSENRSVNVA